MVDNVFIQCDYCKAKIRMRFQMGYFDIPFDFPCPECGVHIHGLRRITEEHSLKLNNAAVVEFDLNEPHYYADFSVELPHAKTTKFESIEKIVTKGFSPFLMSSNLYFNYDFDSDSQRIIFSDKHKGRENAVELYLIDLAILCYENISVLTYLNELLYTLRKIEYVSEGMCIHIKRS